jgi:hypothetical protein
MEVEKDNNAALEFLRKWAPHGPWALAAVDPERKKNLVGQTCDRFDQAESFVKLWNGVRNIYFSVNPPSRHVNKAEKQDIGAMVALHVDLDPADPPKDASEEAVAAHYEAEHARIKEVIANYPIKPSVVVFSGGGYQAFWLLKTPVEIPEVTQDEPEPWAKYEAYNKKLEKELGGDHCHNIERIMRLPGTLNLPDAKKRKKGRTPKLAKLVAADWTRLYSLDDFEPEPLKPQKRPTTKKQQADENGRFPLHEWAQRVLENGPDHEGKYSFNGDRSRALWAVLCTMVRCNWSISEMEASALDKNNKLSEHVYDQNQPAKYIKKQVEKAKEQAGGEFVFGKNGAPVPSQENVRVALGKLDVRLSYDEFSRRHIIEGPDGLPARRLEDREFNNIYLRIAREFDFRPSVDIFKMMVMDECYEKSFHPLKEYLDQLRWDGKARIDTWLVTYAKAKDTPFIRAISSIILMAAVRRVRQPGCKYDEIVVLESPQGFDKSSALAVLATRPEWFTDSMPLNAEDKELIEALEGKWIVESPELKGMRRADIEHQKSVLSRQYDRARLAYGRFTTEVPRQCVFFGSTNADSYLKDTSGNRRFWPVKVDRIDLEGLRRDVHQLWAEASQREAKGESIRLDPMYYAEAALEQERRSVEDPWEGIVEAALVGIDHGKILCGDMWTIVQVPVHVRNQEHNVRLGDVMRKLGWERKKLRFGDLGPKWSYAKGDKTQQMKRVIITRTPDDGLRVDPEGEPDTGVVHRPEQEIPF